MISPFLQFLESVPSDLLPEKVATRILPSFLSSARRNGFAEVSDLNLRIWVVEMFIARMKYATVRRYLGSLHTLFSRWNSDNTVEDPFIDVIADVNEDMVCALDDVSVNFGYISRLLKKSAASDDRVYINAFLYLFYNVGIGVDDVINLKYKEYNSVCPQVDDIVDEMHTRPESKYVFPLKQGKTTPKKVSENLISGMNKVLKSVEMDFKGAFSRNSIKALWIKGALNCNVGVSEICSIIKDDVPTEFSCLRLIQPKNIDDDRKAEIICKVADSVNNTSTRWFVMRMRAGVNSEDVKVAVNENFGDQLKDIAYYYPTYVRTIKEEGQKARFEDTPYLPGILFFKLRSDKVGMLFNKIGNIAWCYRRSANPNSPYCFIPKTEMECFQRHIGKISPDVRMELVTHEKAYDKGTEVLINGGGKLAGHIGKIESVKNADGTRTYTLRIAENVGAVWTVEDVDEIFIEPVMHV